MATRATVTMMLPVLVVGMIGCASKKMDLSEPRQVAVNERGNVWAEERKKEAQAAKDQSLAGSDRISAPPAPEQAQVTKDRTLKSLDEPRLQLGPTEQSQVPNDRTLKSLDEPRLPIESSEQTKGGALDFTGRKGAPTAGQLVGTIVVAGATLYAHAWLAKEYPLAAGTVLIVEGMVIAGMSYDDSMMWGGTTSLVGFAGLGAYNLVNNDHDEASRNDRFRKTLYGMPIIVVTAGLLESIAGGGGKKAEAQRVFATVHIGRDEEAVVLTWRY